MRKRKGAILTGIIAVLLIITMMPAGVYAAWEHGDRGTADFTRILIGKDQKEYYINENVKTVFYDSSGTGKLKAGNGRTKVRWRYLKISDKTEGSSRYGYCAEFGAGFDDTAPYKATDSEKDKNLFQSLPQDAQRIIATALCYGRNGTRKVPVSGANDADYYFATQVILWEAQQGLRTIAQKNGKPSGTKLAAAHNMPAKHMYNFLKGRPAEKCYDWILKKVNDHLKIHSFASSKKETAPVYTMQYDKSAQRWEVTLTDTNKKISGLQCSNKNITITRKNDRYTISCKEKIQTPLMISGQNKMIGGSASGKILTWNCTSKSSNQAMIMGAKDMTSMYLQVKTGQPTQVIVEKKDGETGERIKASYAVFEIKDLDTGKVVVSELETKEDGRACVSEKLHPGNYQLREIKAPQGYVIDKEPKKFVIKEGSETITIEQKDIPQKGRIRVTKMGEAPLLKDEDQRKKLLPLKGTEFDIIAAEDIKTGDGTLKLKSGERAGTLVTDESGQADSGELYLGTYHILETKAPEHYIKQEKPISVKLKYAGEEVKLVTESVTVTNRLKKGAVEIEKTDVSTGAPLPDTGIEILDHNRKSIMKGRTDENGKLFFEKLPAGSYFFREFDAPKGYVIDESCFPFDIRENGQIVKCMMTNKKEIPKTPSKETPKKEKTDHSPQTGDSDSFLFYCIMLLLGAGSTIFLMIYKYKRY